MDRRHFLEIAAAATALGLPGASWLRSPSPALRTLSQPALLALLGERRVREIGALYRQTFPEESEDVLRTAILDGVRPDLHDASTLRACLDRQVRDDFGAGRTVLLHGWMLAVTEARQCALFSLTPA